MSCYGNIESGKYMGILKYGKKYYNIRSCTKILKYLLLTAVLKYRFYARKQRAIYYFMEVVLKQVRNTNLMMLRFYFYSFFGMS